MKAGPGSVSRARVLRRRTTKQEVRLWIALRDRPGGFKFRKQAPADAFVLDFYCPAAGLIIEVDGLSHVMGDRPERDLRRDRGFAARQVETLRFADADVAKNLDGVVATIVERCRERAPPSSG